MTAELKFSKYMKAKSEGRI